MKILVIQQKMIGDVLTSSIMFEVLRAKYPNAQLDYLINTHTLAVVENNPNISNFIFFTKKEEHSKRALFKFAKNLRKNNYSVIIDVYSKLSSNIITLFSGANTKISYYKPYTTFVYTNNIKRYKNTKSKSGLAIVNRLQLLKPLGIEATDVKPKVYLTEAEIKNSKTLLESNGINLKKPLYMISVLGSGDNKTYPFAYMAKVIDRIVEQTKGQLLFNYIPSQKEQAQTIYNLCKEETKQYIFFDVFGKSLREFLAITKHCNALIGNEGGAINMAKALDIKTFAIFSPWISKDDWSLFENNDNVAVHLKDYKPELYNNKKEKEMKGEAYKLYQEFSPMFFDDKLNGFLQQTIS